MCNFEKTANQAGAFYGAMTEIGRAINKRDLADASWKIAFNIIAAKNDKKYARDFLDGENGQSFALCVLAEFPRGAAPDLITDSQLEGCVQKVAKRWKNWP